MKEEWREFESSDFGRSERINRWGSTRKVKKVVMLVPELLSILSLKPANRIHHGAHGVLHCSSHRSDLEVAISDQKSLFEELSWSHDRKKIDETQAALMPKWKERKVHGR